MKVTSNSKSMNANSGASKYTPGRGTRAPTKQNQWTKSSPEDKKGKGKAVEEKPK